MPQEREFQQSKSGEQREQPKSRVLKLSEEALFIDDKYVGECGNPTYKDRDDFFEYDPAAGLLISAGKKDHILAPTDKIKIPHGYGHVTVDDFFYEQKAKFSGKDFVIRLSEFYRNAREALKGVCSLAKAIGLVDRHELIDWIVDASLKRVFEKNGHYSPRGLIDELIAGFEEKLDRDESSDKTREKECFEILKKSAILSLNPENRRAAVVDFFYLYCRAAGIDASDWDQIYEKAFQEFPFIEDLIEEFRRLPDIRFGDALLGACGKLSREWKSDDK